MDAIVSARASEHVRRRSIGGGAARVVKEHALESVTRGGLVPLARRVESKGKAPTVVSRAIWKRMQCAQRLVGVRGGCQCVTLRSASVSRNTLQIPSAWPSTGMRVLRLMCCTSALPPRGITRSMYWSSSSRDATSPRVETSWQASAGSPARSRASWNRLTSAAFEWVAFTESGE